MYYLNENHYFSKLDNQLSNNFDNTEYIISSRIEYCKKNNIKILLIDKYTENVSINDDMYILILNNEKTYLNIKKCSNLIIEDISKKSTSLLMFNNSNCKIIYINHNQTIDTIIKDFSIINNSELNLFIYTNKNNSFIKNNFFILNNINSKSFVNSFIHTSIHQTFDLYVDLIHKNNSSSNINFIGLNENTLVSQINSVVDENTYNVELSQHIKHILLNENALSYSKPSLMISSPCIASHGNSIGSIPEEWKYYLNLRGVDSEKANDLIIQSLLNQFSLEANDLMFDYILKDMYA